jgi:hypothetical protein
MSEYAGDSSGGFLSKAASWMGSFAGITTAIATIMTSSSAILGILVHHQAVQLQQAHTTVSQQAQQIHALKDSAARKPVPAASVGPGAARSPSPASLGGVTHYLSNLTPTVDNGNVFTGQQVISSQSYPNSILFPCIGGSGNQPEAAYDIAGSGTFIAEAGIPDNMQNATGVIATITFSNESGQQIGTPIQVSLGHPIRVKLGIGGVTQLGVTCTGRVASTSQSVSDFEVSLGNAGTS